MRRRLEPIRAMIMAVGTSYRQNSLPPEGWVTQGWDVAGFAEFDDCYIDPALRWPTCSPGGQLAVAAGTDSLLHGRQHAVR